MLSQISPSRSIWLGCLVGRFYGLQYRMSNKIYFEYLWKSPWKFFQSYLKSSRRTVWRNYNSCGHYWLNVISAWTCHTSESILILIVYYLFSPTLLIVFWARKWFSRDLKKLRKYILTYLDNSKNYSITFEDVFLFCKFSIKRWPCIVLHLDFCRLVIEVETDSKKNWIGPKMYI